ncbi:hypothetical protein GGI11_003098 [Coemansia sp. RSA 2049]|nr:hypothetical protein H4217_006734 [Coemansia sp. RSA 1939]KAJ2517653.1 hypothetical protein GGI11_003098 [Coemansia sp. RSA 2049]KAJ2603807.1 hypothetical protein EV177_006604 [Coemansia sp. RSA 1804]
MSRSQQLYGGAMSMAVPAGMEDVSAVREIPDHQEVFANSMTDQSIIVEILETAAEHHEERSALVHHFNELARANDAEEPAAIGRTEQLQLPHTGAEACALVGEQRVAKFNEAGKSADAVNTVCVMLALIRVPPPHSADILVSLNVPLRIGHGSSSHASSSAAQTLSAADIEAAYAEFKAMVGTLQINDYGLFA